MRRVVSLLFGLVLLSSPCAALATGVTPADPLAPIPMTLGIPTWEELGPPARAFAATVHDTRRNRLLVIGGTPRQGVEPATSSVWALDLSHYPSWSRVRPTGPEPSPRWGACAVYDSLRDRVVMFGGAARAEDPNTYPPDSAMSDLWVLTLSGTPAWARIGLADGTRPVPGDTAIAPPAPRVRASLTLDPMRGHAWLFGGERTQWPSGWFGDLWRLDLVTLNWGFQPTPGAHPTARAGHAAAYVPEVDRLVIHGGMDRVQAYGTQRTFSDTWAFNPVAAAWEDWTQTEPVSPTTEHALVWRPVDHELVRLPGETSLDFAIWHLNVLSHVWWRDEQAIVPGRAGQSATWVRDRDWIVATGGNDAAGRAQSDTWGSRLPTSPGESRVFSILPTPLAGSWPAMFAYDARWDRAVLLEGARSLWFHDHTSGIWTRWETQGEAPKFISHATAVLDTSGNRLLVIGGVDAWGMAAHCAVHALSIGGVPTWSRVSTEDGPTLVAPPVLWNEDRSRLVVLEGQAFTRDTLRAWQLSMVDTMRWQRLVVEGAPSPVPMFAAATRDTRRGGAWYHGSTNLPGTVGESLWYVALGDTVRFARVEPAGSHPGGWVWPALTYDPLRDRLLLHGGGDLGLAEIGLAARAWEVSLSATPEWRSTEPLGDRPSSGASRFVDLPDEPQARLEWNEGRLFRVTWELPPPPRAVAESASVAGRVAHLVWGGAATDGWAVRVERRDANGAWMPIGLATSDRDGRWRYVDEDAPEGALAYRLVYDRPAGPIATGEVLLGASPPAATLRIASIRPNPARVPERIEFALPRASAVTFELIDVTGRRVWSRETASLDAGVHVLPLGLAANPRPGLYWLRVKAGGESANARVAIVR